MVTNIETSREANGVLMMARQTMSGFAPIMCAYPYTVVMVLHQTPARKGRVRYTARVKLVLTPTSVERQDKSLAT